MPCLFRPRRKLQWQLSLSYVLVIVVAIPVLLGASLALVALAPSPSPAQQLAQLLAREVAPQVPRPIAGQDARARLNAWATQFVLGQRPVKPGQAQNMPQLNATETLAVLIVDSTGQLAGSSPGMPSRSATSEPANLVFFLQKIQVDVSASQQVIQAAFANAQNLADLVSTQPDGQTLAAAPLLDQRQSVSGVLLVAVRGLYNDTHSSPNAFRSLFPWLPGDRSVQSSNNAAFLPYALLLLLLVSVIGTIFGMITARRITRRLQRMTEAAHAWSVGDFQIHVSDHSSDELGQLAQDLNRMALQVQNLLDARQQLAQLQERQRVARDLHDSVKQQAFALTLLIGAAQARLPADPVAAQGQLYKASDLADQIRQELMAILQQLRPVALAVQGLQEALRTYAHQWSRASGIACEFPASGFSEESGLPILRPEIEEALFRIAQEALANAARHSQASQVQVQCEQRAGQVCLYVRDNGKGFAVEQRAGRGHGLANMRDRVQAYGGTLHISSKPGETVITSCIPLAPETRETHSSSERENTHE